MSGVTTTSRSARSSQVGRRRFPWLNMDVVLRRISKIRTARAGAPKGPGEFRVSAIRQDDSVKKLTREEIGEMILHLAYYAGWPCALEIAHGASAAVARVTEA